MKDLIRNKYIKINGKKVRLMFLEDLSEGCYRLTIWEEKQ